MTRRFPVAYVVRAAPGARTCDSRLRPRAALGIPRRNPAFAKPVQNGHTVDTQIPTDPGKRPAQPIKMDSFVNLLRSQTTATHRHPMPMQDLADRPPRDPESGPQLVHRLATHISGDQFLNLIGTELAGPAGFRSDGGQRSGCGGVGKLPKQGFQGFYLAFRVRVSSPNVHRKIEARAGLHRSWPVLFDFVRLGPVLGVETFASGWPR